MVCLDGLRAAVRTAPPRPRAHPIRQSDLRHDPPQAPQDRRSARDSPLEGDGFEPSVPHKETTIVGHPRSIPRNSPSAKETGSFAPGTDGSNPPPSSGESCANLKTTSTFWCRVPPRFKAYLEADRVSDLCLPKRDRAWPAASLARRGGQGRPQDHAD